MHCIARGNLPSAFLSVSKHLKVESRESVGMSRGGSGS